MFRLRRMILFVAATFLFASLSARAQVQRDAQAVTLVQNALAAMGAVPNSSQATGTIALVAGPQTDSGTITIITSGTTQTSEQIASTYTNQTLIYSDSQANLDQGASVTPLQQELVVTSQCPDFPLPLLAAEFNNPDFALQYIGLETLDGASVQHIHLWNTYTSNPSFQDLASFTAHDLWLDASSTLPVTLSYTQQAAHGVAVPQIPVDVYYSNYTNQGGVLYPFQIQKSFNGTPWATITIQNVVLNVAVTDSTFAIQ
jgi:hypothetical protein